MRVMRGLREGLLCLLLALAQRAGADELVQLHVCESGDPAFLGTYIKGTGTMDGAPVYTNGNDMSFFRNKGFWYLGNLEPWPPETHYRCVEPEGCNPGLEAPPTSAQGAWSANKRFGKEPVPSILLQPCAASDEL